MFEYIRAFMRKFCLALLVPISFTFGDRLEVRLLPDLQSTASIVVTDDNCPEARIEIESEIGTVTIGGTSLIIQRDRSWSRDGNETAVSYKVLEGEGLGIRVSEDEEVFFFNTHYVFMEYLIDGDESIPTLPRMRMKFPDGSRGFLFVLPKKSGEFIPDSILLYNEIPMRLITRVEPKKRGDPLLLFECLK